MIAVPGNAVLAAAEAAAAEIMIYYREERLARGRSDAMRRRSRRTDIERTDECFEFERR